MFYPSQIYSGWRVLSRVLIVVFGLPAIASAADSTVSADQATPWRPPPRPERVLNPRHGAAPSDAAVRVWQLAELTDYALANLPSTRAAWRSAQAAFAAQRVAEAANLPKVSAAANAGRGYGESATYPGVASLTETTWGGQITLSYLLFDFGGRSGAITAARQQAFAEGFRFNQALENAALAVARAYHGQISSEEQLAAAEDGLKQSESAATLARRRRDSGLATTNAVLQADQNLAQANYVLEQARGTLTVARQSLARAVNLPPDLVLRLAPVNTLPEVALLTERLSTLVNAALRQRPDLAAQYATLLAAEANARQQNASRLPRLSVGGTAARSYFQGDYQERAYRWSGEDHKDSIGATLTLSYDVFDGGGNASRSLAARRQADAAQATLEAAEYNVITDVVGAQTGYESAARRFLAAERGLATARRAYDSAVRSYEAGLIGITDLLIARGNLGVARAQRAESLGAAHIGAAQLAYVIGELRLHPRP
jgi:outer membrane protein